MMDIFGNIPVVNQLERAAESLSSSFTVVQDKHTKLYSVMFKKVRVCSDIPQKDIALAICSELNSCIAIQKGRISRVVKKIKTELADIAGEAFLDIVPKNEKVEDAPDDSNKKTKEDHENY